ARSENQQLFFVVHKPLNFETTKSDREKSDTQKVFHRQFDLPFWNVSILASLKGNNRFHKGALLGKFKIACRYYITTDEPC
ncbi:MAG: hypothetical protein ACE5PV_05220, partial [Candidatus Poribacteria bacterium]